MKLLPLLTVVALVVLAAPGRVVAGGTVQVTSGAVAARPVGPQPSLVVVRPGFVQVPVAIGQTLVVTQPLVVARPFIVTQQRVVVTQPSIVIGQPFMITQPGVVQQQIVLPQSGLFFTSQGAMLVVR